LLSRFAISHFRIKVPRRGEVQFTKGESLGPADYRAKKGKRREYSMDAWPVRKKGGSQFDLGKIPRRNGKGMADLKQEEQPHGKD